MSILFVASTQKEAETVPDQYQKFVCGAGIPNAILNLSDCLSQKLPDLIVNVGLAGSFKKEIPIGAVCFVTHDRFAELGSEDQKGNTLSLETLGLENKTETFTSSQHKGNTLHFKVSSLTVFRTSGSKETIDRRKAEYPNAEIETMEGASIHLVAKRFNVPVIQIRSISNFVEPRNRESWDMEKALLELKKFLHQAKISLF